MNHHTRLAPAPLGIRNRRWYGRWEPDQAGGGSADSGRPEPTRTTTYVYAKEWSA